MFHKSVKHMCRGDTDCLELVVQLWAPAPQLPAVFKRHQHVLGTNDIFQVLSHDLSSFSIKAPRAKDPCFRLQARKLSLRELEKGAPDPLSPVAGGAKPRLRHWCASQFPAASEPARPPASPALSGFSARGE